jgi:hypothetical protein
LDAYELAVKERGFVGTLDDWFNSLRGAKGYTGERGIPGTDGESNAIWKPIVTEDGIISFVLDTTDTPPTPMNIKGNTGTFMESDGLIRLLNRRARIFNSNIIRKNSGII